MSRVRLKDAAKLSSGCSLSSEYIDKNTSPNDTYVYGANGIIGSTNVMPNAKNCVLVGRVGSAGETNLCKSSFFATDNVLTLTPSLGVDIEYLYYSVLSLDKEDIISRTANPLLTGAALRLKGLFLPDYSTQVRIALTTKENIDLIDSKVNLYKQKLIHLDEYKTALIHNAVTKGLDANGCRILDGTPAAEMKWKDSGVEWIGEVPEGWGVVSIKSIVSSFGEGGTPSTGNDDYWEDGSIPWVTVSDIKEEIYVTKKMITNAGLAGSSATLWPIGTVILSNAATIGSVGIASVPLCTKQGISGFVVNSDVDNYFFSKLLVEKKDRFNQMARETTFKSLNGAFLKNELVTLPNKIEQESISKFIMAKSKFISDSRDAISKKIALLLEYKKSLINESVSGEMVVQERALEYA